MPPSSQHSSHASSSSATSTVNSEKLENESNQTGDNSSNEIQQTLPNQLPIQSSTTPLSQSAVTATATADAHAEAPVEEAAQETQSVLDQHEDDITQFLHNYSQGTRVIDQFDVTQAIMQQSQAVRGILFFLPYNFHSS